MVAPVTPAPDASLVLAALGRREPVTRLQLLGAAYHWLTCLFVAAMVGSQFLGVIAGSIDSSSQFSTGQDPALGLFQIPNDNDAPFTDRAIVCVQHGASATPMLLADALKSSATGIEHKGAGINGFQVIDRGTKNALDSQTFDAYGLVCQQLAAGAAGVIHSCHELGYNVTTDYLRIAKLDQSATGNTPTDVTGITAALPFLIVPVWDNALLARIFTPGWDGSACVIRVSTTCTNPASGAPVVYGVNRTLREQRTEEWLNRRGGEWSNGWYRDADGMQWYSDWFSTDPEFRDGVTIRFFSTDSLRELTGDAADRCMSDVMVSKWGANFVVESRMSDGVSVVIQNSTHFGANWFYLHSNVHVRSVYDWETLTSNSVLSLLLLRWMVTMAALHRGYVDGHSDWHSAGIGCVANAQSFKVLPLLLLPRLKMTLCAFCTAGVLFQGQQAALESAWFVMYPAIVEIVVYLYAVINLLAKLLRRRVTDAFFAPTVVLLVAIHYFRVGISRCHWFGLDISSPVMTLVGSDELGKLQLVDFLVGDAADRMSGDTRTLLLIKVGILTLNLLPLLVAGTIPVERNLPSSLRGVEQALALRARNVGGLGGRVTYVNTRYKSRATSTISSVREVELSGYELVRLGYIVYGQQFLISFEDWDILSLMASFRHLYYLWNYRVVAHKLHKQGGSHARVERPLCIYRLDDPRINRISVWNLSAWAISC